MNTNDDVLFTSLKTHKSDSGNLVVFDYNHDFKKVIKRSFLVSCSRNSLRGKHAHKTLTQFLVCVYGKCIVSCDDGLTKKEFILNSSNKILKVPNQIWSEQSYELDNSTLLVMCDDVFKEDDYIRDYKLFKDFRKNL